MMYRGSKFLAVSIIELPLINKVSLELISARGDGGGAKSYIHEKVGPNHSLHTYLHIGYTIILNENFYRPGQFVSVNGTSIVH
jgi:hypothetical protein